jgi:hypothetical protein
MILWMVLIMTRKRSRASKEKLRGNKNVISLREVERGSISQSDFAKGFGASSTHIQGS